jgi:hypothetical protein
MLNENLLKTHSRKTLRELIKLEKELYLEVDEIKKKDIQNKICLCECLSFKDYKLFIN